MCDLASILSTTSKVGIGEMRRIGRTAITPRNMEMKQSYGERLKVV